jgi:hypothetical protein
MNCIKFISKLFAPKESQIPYNQVLSMDPRKTTTQQRKKARLEMKQHHFNNYNNERARRCIEPITYAEYNKMLKLKELSEEKYIESNENNRMNCFDKKKNNNQKKLLYKNYDQKKLVYRNYGPTDEFAGMNRKEREAVEAQRKHEEYMRRTAAGETEQGRRDLERLAIVKKRREEDRLKREAEGRAPGWTPNGVASSSDDSDDDKPIANPPANNPNLVKKTGEEMIKAKDLVSIDGPTDEFAGMNRKEREAVEEQIKYEEYVRRTIEQSHRDLERLAAIRKKREEDILKREAEGRVPGWMPNGVASSSDDDKPIVKKTGEKIKKVRFCSMDGQTDEFAGINSEAVEAQRKYTEYVCRTAAGETDKSRRDFERLTYIRKKRGLAPGWNLYEIDSDVANIDSDVSDDEIKESKLFNKNSSTLIQNIPNYSENTNLFEKNEDNTNLVILDNKIRYYCNICNKKYFSKTSLCNHNKKFHTDYYRF